MTDRLYLSDPYLVSFTARVVAGSEQGGRPSAVLDRTAFYPEGGGQPADRGTLGGARVVDVQESEGDVVHVLDRQLPSGTEVEGRVDWVRRLDLRRDASLAHGRRRRHRRPRRAEVGTGSVAGRVRLRRARRPARRRAGSLAEGGGRRAEDGASRSARGGAPRRRGIERAPQALGRAGAGTLAVARRGDGPRGQGIAHRGEGGARLARAGPLRGHRRARRDRAPRRGGGRPRPPLLRAPQRNRTGDERAAQGRSLGPLRQGRGQPGLRPGQRRPGETRRGAGCGPGENRIRLSSWIAAIRCGTP